MRLQWPLAVACLVLVMVVPLVLPLNTLPVITFYQEWLALALVCGSSGSQCRTVVDSPIWCVSCCCTVWSISRCGTRIFWGCLRYCSAPAIVCNGA
jgi:hypothetical protein